MSKSNFFLNGDAISCKAFCRIGFCMLRKRWPKRKVSSQPFNTMNTSMHQHVCTCDRMTKNVSLFGKMTVLRSLPGENVRIGRCSWGISHGRTFPSITQTAEVCLFALTNWPSSCQKLTSIPFGHKSWVISNHWKAAANVEKQAGRKKVLYNLKQTVPCAKKLKGWIHFKCCMLTLSSRCSHNILHCFH